MEQKFNDVDIAIRRYKYFEGHNPFIAARNKDCEWCYFATMKEKNGKHYLGCNKIAKYKLEGKNRTLVLKFNDFCYQEDK